MQWDLLPEYRCCYIAINPSVTSLRRRRLAISIPSLSGRGTQIREYRGPGGHDPHAFLPMAAYAYMYVYSCVHAVSFVLCFSLSCRNPADIRPLVHVAILSRETPVHSCMSQSPVRESAVHSCIPQSSAVMLPCTLACRNPQS